MIRFNKWPENPAYAWTGFTMAEWSGGTPDAAVHEVVQWSVNQFGLPGNPQAIPDGQRWIHRYETFIFTQLEDATAFRLRWC